MKVKVKVKAGMRAAAFALLLSVTLPGGVWGRQDSPVKTALLTAREVPAAKEVKLPLSAKRGLPRGAKTLFSVESQIGGRPVLLHGWNRASESDRYTTLDIVSLPSARRLKRIRLRRFDPLNISVEVAPLGARSRGTAIVLDYNESQVAGAFSSVPLRVITLPVGLTGRAIVEDFTTEAEPGGGDSYQGSVAADGTFFLLHRSWNEVDPLETHTRFLWNGRTYKSEGESVKLPPKRN